MYQNGEEFLNKLYSELHLDKTVLSVSKGESNSNLQIKKYLEFQERLHKRYIEQDKKDLLLEWYYDKYVIKELPESYTELQKKIALERGYGHVNVTPDMKKQMLKEVQDNQKQSLKLWIDYLISSDAMYPMWFKYFAFQGMLRLGKYDKKNNKFSKRSNNTVEPFCDLNMEVLANIYDFLNKVIGNKEISPEDTKIFNENGNFQKLYTYFLRNSYNNKKKNKETKGIWKKYNQGENYQKLWQSLQGKNTGWCTAGEATCKDQIKNGDFYVYYSIDEKGNYTNPRIAIRMEGQGKIGEIRGVSKNQEMESEMLPILEEKLKEFPDRANYYKKVNDMKTLTEIYNKTQNNPKAILTIEELTFLYEINYEINSFGYIKDPRIEEIKKERNNQKEDLARIFNCDKSQIAMFREEITEKTVCYYGNLYLSNLESAEGLILPQNIIGDLDLFSLKNAKGLVFPQSIGGCLDLRNLKSAEGLVLPPSIGGGLYLGNLKSAEGLTLPQSIGGGLYLSHLESAEGLVLPQSIGGYLDLSSLESAKGLTLPRSMGGNLYLRNLKSAEGLTLPQSIGGGLYLSHLESAEGLILRQNIIGDLDLSFLRSAEGLTLPQNIGGSLCLNSLRSAEGLILPQSIGGYLDLNSLKSAENLILPQSIDGDLYLGNLKNAEGLVLPQSIGGSLFLNGLRSAEGLVFPDNLTYTIYMKDFDITSDSVDEYRNKKSK